MEFDVILSEKDIYRFSMYHAYLGGMQGIFSVVIAILVAGIAISTAGNVEILYTILYLGFSVVFLVYIPVTLKLRARQQLKSSGTLSRPLHYKIDESKIMVSQGEATAELPWEQIYKMVSTKKNLLIYSNRVHAYILPRVQIEENYGEIKSLAETKLARYRLKMKA